MTEIPKDNWTKLNERSLNARSSISGSYLNIEGLDLDLAVTLAHYLTDELDNHNGLYIPSPSYNEVNFSLERSLAEAREEAATRSQYVFGETRPADGNMAVRVERGVGDRYELTADVRNELEDRPELDGGRILQLGFIAVVQSLKI